MQPEKVSCIIAGCVLDLAGHLAELFISVPREVRLLIAWCAAPGHSLRVGRFPEIVGYLPGGALATQTATQNVQEGSNRAALPLLSLDGIGANPANRRSIMAKDDYVLNHTADASERERLGFLERQYDPLSAGRASWAPGEGRGDRHQSALPYRDRAS
jgi:hypothetical protein